MEHSSQATGVSDLLSRLWISILFLVFAAAFWISISDLSGEAANYPRAAIILLVLFVLYGMTADVLSWRRGVAEVLEDDEAQAGEHEPGIRGLWAVWQRTVAAFVLTVAFVWAIPRAGYYESSAVYLLALFFLLGVHRPVILLPLTLGLTVASYLLFELVFNVVVPSGPLLG